MKVPIKEIRVKDGRRGLDPAHIKELVDSIRELGLLNPPTVDRENVLIAGLHRLEAVKQLGWTEVECTVSSLEGLQAELAEIDENFVRSDLSVVEYGEMLLRRKEIYEAIHPEVRHGGDRKSGKIKCAKCTLDAPKSFVDDTADKLKVDPCTVRRQIQTARNLTPETKEIIKDADTKISRKAALKLSRLEPGQQREAAELLAAQKIRTVDEYVARQEGMGGAAVRPETEQRLGVSGMKVSEPKAPEQKDSVTGVSEKKVSGTEVFIAEASRDTALITKPREIGDYGIEARETTDSTLSHRIPEGQQLPASGKEAYTRAVEHKTAGLAMQEEQAEGGQKRQDCQEVRKESGQMIQKKTESVAQGDSELEYAGEKTRKPEKESETDTGKILKDEDGEDSLPEVPAMEAGISLKEIVAELKDPDKDCSGTPDSFLQEYDAFVQKFHREIGWYSNPYYDTVYPFLTAAQFAELERMTDSICSAAEALLERAGQMRRG